MTNCSKGCCGATNQKSEKMSHTVEPSLDSLDSTSKSVSSCCAASKSNLHHHEDIELPTIISKESGKTACCSTSNTSSCSKSTEKKKSCCDHSSSSVKQAKSTSCCSSSDSKHSSCSSSHSAAEPKTSCGSKPAQTSEQEVKSSSCCSSKGCSRNAKAVVVVEKQQQSTSCSTSCCSKSSNDQVSSVYYSSDHASSASVLVDMNSSHLESEIAEVKLTITKIHCADCAIMAEETVRKNPAIISIQIIAITNSALVRYNRTMISSKQVCDEIAKFGFGVSVASDSSFTKVMFNMGEGFAEAGLTVDDRIAATTPGIRSLSVERYVLTVYYDPEITGVRTLKAVIEESHGPVSLYFEPRSVQVDQANEIYKWRLQFIISLSLSVPIFILSFIVPLNKSVHAFFEQSVIQGLSIRVLISWFLATPIQFVLGKPLYLSAYRAIRYAKKPNMDTLVMLSTTTAYFYSVVSTVIAMLGKDFQDESFFETSAMLLTFIILGRYCEILAKGKTSDILSKMMELRVDKAILVSDDEEEEIDIELVQRRDVLKVTPGARVPTDGIVVYGTTTIDESMITGESIPVLKELNHLVYGGTINQNGTIHIQVTKIAAENTLSEIDRAIHEAQAEKAPIQRIADTVSAYFIPVIVLMAIIAFIVWLSLAYANVFKPTMHPIAFALQFALAILVISCPCAISLAAPTAVMVGIGQGAKFGVLYKSGPVIETCHKVNTVVFDKTGTLTVGKPVVTNVEILDDNMQLSNFLYLVGSAELGSEHVIGKAIVNYAKEELKDMTLVEPADYQAEPGRGFKCSVFGDDLIVGNTFWMQENFIGLNEDVVDLIASYENDRKTVICVCIGKVLCGVIALSDTPKPEARLVVRELKKQGIEVWVVSGDNAATTHAIADDVGITNVIGEALPSDKADKIRELQSQGKIVAMVGDGVNDSISIARADVGMAIGAGSDITLETADIVLMKSDLRDVLVALDLSKTTYRRIKINFLWAFFYNAIGIPLAAGLLYPMFHITIPPAIAGLSEIFSSLPVVFFSLLLQRYKPKKYFL